MFGHDDNIISSFITRILSGIDTLIGQDIAGSVVITQNSTSQSVTVPFNARSYRVSTRGGAASLEFNRPATTDSSLYVPDESIDYYPINGEVDLLYCYGTVGKAYFRFQR